MPFDADTVTAMVTAFCRARQVEQTRPLRVVEKLEDAFRIVALKGPDERWKKIHLRSDPGDVPSQSALPSTGETDQQVYDYVLRKTAQNTTIRHRVDAEAWFLRKIIVSTHHWARFSRSLRTASEHGLGWVIPAHHDVLMVPRPAVRWADGPASVMHEETGRKAIEWPDGGGYYFLHGIEFNEALYRTVIAGELTIQQITALRNADQRSIALSYLTFDRLITNAKAQLLDTGVKGTALYRVPLPTQLARDRMPGYGRYDYFIHMHDTSYPEREFIEWVDQRIGEQRNAELCQARAFGITLEQWLSIEQEG